MKDHLTYSSCRLDKDIRKIEVQLIEDLRPPLNLTDWHNPQAAYLQALRCACRHQASSERRQR